LKTFVIGFKFCWLKRSGKARMAVRYGTIRKYGTLEFYAKITVRLVRYALKNMQQYVTLVRNV